MAVSVSASKKGLDIVDRLRRNRGWTKHSVSWCEAARIGQATLKRFWRGLPVLQENFIQICAVVGATDWESLINDSSYNNQGIDFSAYDECWVGRQSLIDSLSDQLKSGCRLLVLVGITGIGKTALAERLTFEMEEWLQDDLSRIYRENFDYQDKVVTFADVGARLLESQRESVTPEQRNDAEYMIERLVSKLKQERCLIVIDALENILSGNEDDGWGGFSDSSWKKFFKKVFLEPSLQQYSGHFLRWILKPVFHRWRLPQ